MTYHDAEGSHRPTRWDVPEDDAPDPRELLVGLLMFSPIWLLAGLGWLFLPALLRSVGL